MGIPGACANYFFDEFVSVAPVLAPRLPTCADVENIGPVPLQLAGADAGDATEFNRSARPRFRDRHQRPVGEDTEVRLAAFLCLGGAPLAQSLVEAFVHVGGA